MFNPAGGSVNHHQSRMVARLDWMLRDQIVRKVEIKLGREHPCLSTINSSPSRSCEAGKFHRVLPTGEEQVGFPSDKAR